MVISAEDHALDYLLADFVQRAPTRIAERETLSGRIYVMQVQKTQGRLDTADHTATRADSGKLLSTTVRIGANVHTGKA
jgi:hypothetical protein